MLTLFTIPRAFSGQAGIAQDNAIASWTRLHGCEVILFGDDPGVAEAAARHGVRHVPEVKRNPHGTPLLDDVFIRADALARWPLLCFVNADIVLFHDLLTAVEAVAAMRERFLIVSSRFNLAIIEPLCAEQRADLRTEALQEHRMYPAGGTDIFVYRRGLFGEVPPFAIGRGYWDNWLMRRARECGAELVDVTGAVVVVHQDHDYAHVTGVSPGAANDAPFALDEAQQNLALAGGAGRLYTAYDASAVLGSDHRLLSTLRPTMWRRRSKAWLRRLVTGISPGILRRFRGIISI
jgi:hypothetical protein